ncbi:hypothetical protein F2Q69_00006223 [Brassica cretica]|uniref:RNase H type-1 domain-containing protein n=1 Tax=Brassica cretica TaxID=69181 RepID=A0A8S9PPD3_BRACR|nr:hypothetical protein F2Q69_00006223 [Brassica cretica]
MARDHTGNVLFHGRDAFTPSTSRLAAELRGIIWVLQSANDLHLHTGAHANTIARDITKNVLKDGRFQSYLALGGPAWLHQRIAAEASRQD